MHHIFVQNNDYAVPLIETLILETSGSSTAFRNNPIFFFHLIWYYYCIPIQICIEISDLIGREAVRTGAYGLAYGLAYGPANGRSDTRHQIYYFRRVIGEIRSVRMWSSISNLPYSKSNVRHEETVLVPSMLFQISD